MSSAESVPPLQQASEEAPVDSSLAPPASEPRNDGHEPASADAAAPGPETTDNADPAAGDDDDIAALVGDAVSAAVAAPGNDGDQSAALGEAAGEYPSTPAGDAVADAAAVAAAAAAAETPVRLPPGLTLRDLFGPYFVPREGGGVVPGADAAGNAIDPAAADIGAVVEDAFGVTDWAALVFARPPRAADGAAESSADAAASLVIGDGSAGRLAVERQLSLLVSELEGLAARQSVAEVFGDGAVELVVDALRRGVSGRRSQVVALPRPPLTDMCGADQQKRAPPGGKPAARDSWLLHMPVISKTRRSLHVERSPYVPGLSTVQRASNDRAIYTPLNVIRYAHDDSRGVDLSNARLIKWSSGKWTLHIGTDAYTVADDQTDTLVVIGQEVDNTAAAEFAPRGIDGAAARRIFVETVPYARRMQLQPADSVGNNSVVMWVMAEGRVRTGPELKLVTEPVIVSKPRLPGQPKSARRIEGSDEVAEFVQMNERERDRILRERNGGREPTIFERMAFDAQVADDIRKAQTGSAEDFSELVADFKKRLEAATAAAASSATAHRFGAAAAASAGAAAGTSGADGGRRRKRGRFDRDATLGDALGQADGDDGGDGDDEDNELAVTHSRRSGSRRGREEHDEAADVASDQPTTHEGVMQQLGQMRLTPGVSPALRDEIDGLRAFFESRPDLSVEAMLHELNAIENKLIGAAASAATGASSAPPSQVVG